MISYANQKNGECSDRILSYAYDTLLYHENDFIDLILMEIWAGDLKKNWEYGIIYVITKRKGGFLQ